MTEFIMMPVPISQFAAVCALLGGASTGTIAAADRPSPAPAPQPQPQPQPQGTASPASEPSAEQAATAAANDDVADAGDPNELDAGGWPWSADMHAATKGKTKDGFWRMKVGVSRPDPKPGFPKTDAAPTAAPSGSENGAGSAPSTPAATGAADGEDEDEFAAFRAAAEKSNATDASAAASVPARKWTDADLGALCNQAAVKLGDPAPVKEIIGKFIPEGGVAHSRNIPEDKREEFAKAVEAKAGITFAA